MWRLEDVGVTRADVVVGQVGGLSPPTAVEPIVRLHLKFIYLSLLKKVDYSAYLPNAYNTTFQPL